MGTRNITIVIYNDEVKIAQYGQWDGYLGGQGQTILYFLSEADLEVFKEKLLLVTLVDDYDNIDERLADRDLGAKILQEIYTNDKPVVLHNSYSFAGNSLFCEWGYVVNLDRNILEVYKGFNTIELSENERFHHLSKEGEEYQPISLLFVRPIQGQPNFTDYELKLAYPDDDD